jgi:hypothetical protein
MKNAGYAVALVALAALWIAVFWVCAVRGDHCA